MRTLLILFLCLYSSGCAYYLSPRPPILERKLGALGDESIGAIATAADYRMVYAPIKKDAKICAEPPPDAAGQFASILGASLSGLGQENKNAESQAKIEIDIKRIFVRSQGVQLYRDGAFSLCNAYINRALNKEDYLRELRALRKDAARLVHEELPYIHNQSESEPPKIKGDQLTGAK